jgi:hypothetical protein
LPFFISFRLDLSLCNVEIPETHFGLFQIFCLSEDKHISGCVFS